MVAAVPSRQPRLKPDAAACLTAAAPAPHRPAPAAAVVKVLQLLPAAAMRFQLPRTLQKVANLLRVRLQSTRCAFACCCRRSPLGFQGSCRAHAALAALRAMQRTAHVAALPTVRRDAARAVLVSMVKQLGPDYLPFVCEVLQSGEHCNNALTTHFGWSPCEPAGVLASYEQMPAQMVHAPAACCCQAVHRLLPPAASPPCRPPLPLPRAACPPKGYTAHVLGYTVHAVIEAVAQVGQPGCQDDSLLMILPLMEASWGRVGAGCGHFVGCLHTEYIVLLALSTDFRRPDPEPWLGPPLCPLLCRPDRPSCVHPVPPPHPPFARLLPTPPTPAAGRPVWRGGGGQGGG